MFPVNILWYDKYVSAMIYVRQCVHFTYFHMCFGYVCFDNS